TTVDISGKPMSAVLMRFELGDGYQMILGRRTGRFQRLEVYFGYGLAGATLVILVIGVIGGLMIRRALLAELHGINETASAIVQGDLTRRLPVEGNANELDLLAQTVNRMLDLIEHLVNGIRNVSNAIAHDLRTPLTELRARLELLLVQRPSADAALLEIENAVADVDRVIGIFNALLRLAEIETGARRSGFSRVDVAEIARESVDFYLPLAELKDITLACACDAPIAIVG